MYGDTLYQEVVILVKGISRQVIVVQAPDPKLFDQAIFILKDDIANGKEITEDILLREAHRLINAGASRKRIKPHIYALLWSGIGAFTMAVVWLVSTLI